MGKAGSSSQDTGPGVRVWEEESAVLCPGEGHSGSGGIMGNERQSWTGQVLKGLD